MATTRQRDDDESPQQLTERLSGLQRRADALAREAEQAKGRLAAADEELATRWGCKTAAAAERLLKQMEEEAVEAARAETEALATLRQAVDALEAALEGGAT